MHKKIYLYLFIFPIIPFINNNNNKKKSTFILAIKKLILIFMGSLNEKNLAF